jgi:hypothetical protein
VVALLVSHLGIQHAMAIPSLLCIGIVFLATTMPKSDADLDAARAGH